MKLIIFAVILLLGGIPNLFNAENFGIGLACVILGAGISAWKIYKIYQDNKAEEQQRVAMYEAEQKKRAAAREAEQKKQNEAEQKYVVKTQTSLASELKKKNTEAEKALKNITDKLTSLQNIAKSIEYAQEEWIGENPGYAANITAGLSLEELMPIPDLNCMTVKELKARYIALRKQIVSLCESYEKRYNSKTNATIYKLLVLAMEAEIENILNKLQFEKLDSSIDTVRKMTAKYYAVATEGNQNIASTLKRFIGQIEYFYIDILKTEYEYYLRRERAKEEQRALKEQMRQEAEERKRLEDERRKVDAEESKYRQEIQRITDQMQKAHDSELEALHARLAELEQMVGKVEERKAEIINLQNGKAGTVYIISNIGSFGEDVFKIGMTRRLEPQDRVNELGDASVPFPFDVHSFIFSQDAPALENAIHKELNDRRVNKVNLRKEFFKVNIEELQQIVERIDPTAPFRVTALAEQYRQSLSIDIVPDTQIEFNDDEENE